MTESDRLTRLVSDPRYLALIHKRGRFTWTLTIVMLIAYFGFILLIAFDKAALAAPIASGVTSVGIPAGLGVILLAIGLTGLYVRRANMEFDALVESLNQDLDA